jgi:hypothetical protein
VAALAYGWKRKTKGMSALLNHGFGSWFNHHPFREKKKGVIYQEIVKRLMFLSNQLLRW